MDKSPTNKKARMNMEDLWTRSYPVVLGTDIAIVVTKLTIVAVATCSCSNFSNCRYSSKCINIMNNNKHVKKY